MLCTAFQNNFIWPGYVHIFGPQRRIEGILQLAIETSCSREELLTAMEGAFILDFRLYVENDTELVSGVNYGEYQQLYADKLEEYVNSDNLQKNTYANSLYDRVWAFSLAINKSLTSMKSQNLSFDDFAFGKRKMDQLYQIFLNKNLNMLHSTVLLDGLTSVKTRKISPM